MRKFSFRFFDNHNIYKINEINQDIPIEYCQEKNHFNKLEYYCKNHNKLCCSSCISKIKGKGNGEHSNCEISFIEDIQNEKINKLNENIISLEKLSASVEQSFNKLKAIFVKISEDKDNLKLKVQNIFTKIRNEINNREDKILLDIHKYFDDLYVSKEFMKEAEKLPKEIKSSINKGKKINQQLNDGEKKIISLIYDCLNIENKIKDINLINDKITSYNLNTTTINSDLEENLLNNLLDILKILGTIYYSSDYKFNRCPEEIQETQKYEFYENNESIVIKTGKNINNMMNIFNNNNENNYLIEQLNDIFEGKLKLNEENLNFDVDYNILNNNLNMNNKKKEKSQKK